MHLAHAEPTTLRFTLPAPSTTSAGLFDGQGRLLRALWSGDRLSAGLNNRVVDLPASSREGTAQIVLIHHSISALWEGVIGNSSSAFVGPAVHRAFQVPGSLAVAGSRVYYAVAYNEGQRGLHAFDQATPRTSLRAVENIDPFVALAMVATDGSRVFAANVGGLSKTSFVLRFDISNRQQQPFAEGQHLCLNRRPNSNNCYPDQDYRGVIDVINDPADVPTGLAVQRNGPLLAVARGKRQLIQFFDKATGRRLGELRAPLDDAGRNRLAFAPDGDLWVLGRGSARRYTDMKSVPGPLAPRLAATVEGLSAPLAIVVHPEDRDVVWIADGGTSQQLKRFDRMGRPVETLGVAGGYRVDPAVTAEKLCFSAASQGDQTAVAVTADGTLWVVDTCNNRTLHFARDKNGRWLNSDQIAYLPHSYKATVDHGNPRRVFSNFLEFEVDSAAPLQPGDRSWRLVRNWLAGLPDSLQDDRSKNSGFGGFTSVETLANGRTFALLEAQGRQVIVHLPATGPLRVVRTLAAPMPQATAKVLYENGDLGYALTGPKTQIVLRLPLTGFDANGDPVWAREPVKLAAVPIEPGSPHYRGAFSGMPPRFPVTGSGHVVFFDGSVTGNEGFHLGAARQGDADWLWRASPTGPLDGKGSFQTRAIDGALNYGGNTVWAHGRHVLYGYHGEFYKDMQNGRVGQANQFMHFLDNGLFVSQFGTPSTRATMDAEAGLSGNAFSPTLVRSGDKLYLYHNDESAHGGVHRWRIDGWDRIGELSGRGAAGGVIELR